MLIGFVCFLHVLWYVSGFFFMDVFHACMLILLSWCVVICMLMKILAMVLKIGCFSYFMYPLSKIIDTDIVCLQTLLYGEVITFQKIMTQKNLAMIQKIRLFSHLVCQNIMI